MLFLKFRISVHVSNRELKLYLEVYQIRTYIVYGEIDHVDKLLVSLNQFCEVP